MDNQPDAVWEHNFVQRMKRLREAREMTQTDLARVLRAHGLLFHQQTVQRIESGERPVRLNEAYIIANVLNVSLAEMVTSTDVLDMEIFSFASRLRRDSNKADAAIKDAVTEWLFSVEYFFDVLSRHIKRIGAETPDDLDPAAQWGLAWAFKVDMALPVMLKAAVRLSQIQGSSANSEEEIDWAHVTLSNEIRQTLEHWREKFHTADIEKDSLIPSKKLIEKFPHNPGSIFFENPPF